MGQNLGQTALFAYGSSRRRPEHSGAIIADYPGRHSSSLVVLMEVSQSMLRPLEVHMFYQNCDNEIELCIVRMQW